MKNLLSYTTLVIAAIFLSGCGSNYRLSGKVTFKDGKPAERGMIIFSDGKNESKGEIQQNGSFVVGTLKTNDGLPAGEYKVYVLGIEKPGKGGMGGIVNYVPMCDDKYQSPNTSGLTCKVPAPGNKYDIVLDPHPKNYP